MSRTFSSQRRLFLESAALASGGLFLTGCVRRIPGGALPPPDRTQPLTIDIHCHIFNGTDLQMQSFITDIYDNEPGAAKVPPDIAQMLQNFDWKKAPDGAAEQRAINAVDEAPASATAKVHKTRVSSYNAFRKEVLKAQSRPTPVAAATQVLTPGAAGAGSAGATAVPQPQGASPAAVNEKLPASYGDFEQMHETAAGPAESGGLVPVSAASSAPGSSGITSSNVPLHGGPLPGFLEYFQYRYVELHDYLKIYDRDGSRTVDLMISHLVDFDWPLNAGAPTRTTLDAQVDVMSTISLKSNGRVHTFAPFDPFREIAHYSKLHGADWSPLDRLPTWVSKGCIGVKLYPPMGFAPYGNSSIGTGLWRPYFPWIKDCDHVPDGKGGTAPLGVVLDAVLEKLYKWCLSEDIPIVAHTDVSNGRNTDFDALTAAEHWASLKDNFGGLRINFGHLGDFEKTSPADWQTAAETAKEIANARKLVMLMASDPGAAGGKFYGDSAFNEKIIDQYAALETVYRTVLVGGANRPAALPLLRDRLMYGSDWSLLMLDKGMETYLADFIRLYNTLDQSANLPQNQPSLSDRFFGANAADFLGLRKGGPTRTRIEAFYRNNNFDFNGTRRPEWMNKVDALGPAISA